MMQWFHLSFLIFILIYVSKKIKNIHCELSCNHIGTNSISN